MIYWSDSCVFTNKSEAPQDQKKTTVQQKALHCLKMQIYWDLYKQIFYLLKDTGSKHCSKVLGRHAVFYLIPLHQSQEFADVAQEGVVNIWQLPEEVFNNRPGNIVSTDWKRHNEKEYISPSAS